MSGLDAAAPRILKITGGDVELGNYTTGADTSGHASAHRAARALLAAIPGIRDFSTSGGGYDGRSQDWGRKHLPENGGCFYIDLGHLEACTGEVTSARDYLVAWEAAMSIAREALARVNAGLPEGERVMLTADNSDGHGSSWGGHLSVLVSRDAWERLFSSRVYPDLFFLAAHHASSIVYTGQGKVGAENGGNPVRFQLTRRGDFFEAVVGEQTTHRRPVVNCRDEALCGHAEGLARLHVIFYDTNLAHVATYLKVGTLQIVAAMCEAGWATPRTMLESPLEALCRWGRDPGLRARARLADGASVTAVEHQQMMLETARRFFDHGGCEGRVPDAGRILNRWESTLDLLARRDLERLVGQLDWVTKRALIGEVLDQGGFDWRSPQARHLDLLYANLDPELGLYLSLVEDGEMERLVTEAEVLARVAGPPEDTRAWTRAMLLRAAEPDAIDRVDWHSVRVRRPSGGTCTVSLPHPARHTRAETEAAFAGATDLDDLLDRLGATDDGAGYAAGSGQASSTSWHDDYHH